MGWKEELVEFAAKLGYSGKISGYDISDSFGKTSSAYVEFRMNGDKCDLYLREWTEKGQPKNKVANPIRHDHVRKHKQYAKDPTLQDLEEVCPSVNRNNLVNVHKQKLR